ncbi:MAG: post-segregation antitoxin CcdA [Mesorhizobium sp.]|uniref:type II toxin-antitoxin system CcdA family antitoxin n=1 Tax=unclassified Mesorhizobium TaxID=325217 RepID=UPI000F75C289|nr:MULTISPECIES: type II toxin-antitoxin system CcdA family antitoxin [unclassified Mesorhizobium]AZO73281.1 post-segregation antitoxin CcdA [Mesorhizobium sp. M1D.F.Ca.ET.043.01.1.1]RWA88689.1 MAG: post-segregation antitoxin CcdA [Mesorhizobium sp.]RWD97079.1 MAG: post-segregation antitoxin CcdA [Mesorhizobium sp.]TJW68626.1 MAG: post-segregation antitoxin CcdA [Mesorhizobium sp.]
MFRPSSRPERKSIRISIDPRLIEEAKAVGIDISAVSEAAIATAVSAEKTRRWQEENREAIDSSNDYVRRNGLPLAKYRLF